MNYNPNIPRNTSVEYRAKWSFSLILTGIVVVLNSGYALTVGYNRIIPLITALFAIVLYIKANTVRPVFAERLEPEDVLLIVMIITMFLAAIINDDFSSWLEYLRLFAVIVTAFCIAKILEIKIFAHYFTYIMRFITVISIVLFTLIDNSIISLPIIKNGMDVSYYTAYIFSCNSSVVNLRNSGIFWEAGLFAAFIMLALIFEIVYMPKNKYKTLFYFVYGYALFSTESTAAYVYILMAVILLLSYKANNFIKILLVSSLIIGTVYLYLYYDEIIDILISWQPTVFRKLSLENFSVTDRTYNPLADLLISLEYPLGSGVGSVTNLSKEFTWRYFAIDLRTRTSTLTYFFAAFGIFSGVIYNYSWIRGLAKKSNLKTLTKIIIIISVIMLATSSPLNANMTFWIIVFMFTKNTISSNKNHRNAKHIS